MIRSYREKNQSTQLRTRWLQPKTKNHKIGTAINANLFLTLLHLYSNFMSCLIAHQRIITIFIKIIKINLYMKLLHLFKSYSSFLRSDVFLGSELERLQLGQPSQLKGSLIDHIVPNLITVNYVTTLLLTGSWYDLHFWP